MLHFGHIFSVFEAICDDSQGQGFNASYSFVLRLTIGHRTRQFQDLGQPTAIFFALCFNS